MLYERVEDLSIVVRKKLPKDALKVFLNAAQVHDNEHDCLVAGWDAVKERWRKSDKPGEKWVKRPMRKGSEEMSGSFNTGAEIVKVDEGLGLVFGWAIICSENGEPYFDKNYNSEKGEFEPDHIPEDVMLKSSVEFMESERVAGDMHKREDGAPVRDGSIVFMMPMTADVAKAYGIETSKTGLMIAARPSPEVLEKFKSGEYTGFSIGGSGKKELVE